MTPHTVFTLKKWARGIPIHVRARTMGGGEGGSLSLLLPPFFLPEIAVQQLLLVCWAKHIPVYLLKNAKKQLHGAILGQGENPTTLKSHAVFLIQTGPPHAIILKEKNGWEFVSSFIIIIYLISELPSP